MPVSRPAQRRPPRPRWRRWQREDIVLADVEVAGGVHVANTAPHLVQVQPGQRLRLACPYRFVTRSRSHEDFDAHLQVSLDGEGGPTKERSVDEGIVRHRRSKGRLHQDLVFRVPGVHIVRWAVEVQYGVRAWGSGQAVARGHERTQGLLRIEVMAAPT